MINRWYKIVSKRKFWIVFHEEKVKLRDLWKMDWQKADIHGDKTDLKAIDDEDGGGGGG
jgi:hypothetical protein